MSVSPQLNARVSQLLGREPRGLREVICDDDGEPLAIRVASLVDGKPFPTLYWLVGPDLCYRIDQAEAGGLIAQLQARVDDDPDLRASMAQDHAVYIAARDAFMTEEERRELAANGFGDVLQDRGVGGIADFTRIRCLHTWYAAHLVTPNTIGGLLDDWWARQDA